MSELRGPKELVAQAVRAEAAGFDFAVQSDHFHPWLDSHGHSPFAWSVLAAAAQATDALPLATMVTCPFGRYHPAIIAQAAATVAVLNDGRFTLGLGAGERLNEHVVGGEWPPADVRHEHLAESIEGHAGALDGRVDDVPRAARDRGGRPALRRPRLTAGDLHRGQRSGQRRPGPRPRGGRLRHPARGRPRRPVHTAGGGAPGDTWAQLPVSWDRDAERALELAHERFRFGVPGWKVMAELPNIVNFEAATASVRKEDVAESVPSGSDVGAVVDALGEFVDAGYTRVAVVQVGDDIDGFLDAWTSEIAPELEARVDATGA